MKKILISPQVYFFETDKSELYYLSNRARLAGGGGSDTGSGSGLSPQNNENNYLLLETGFYLLQEDGSKLYL